MVLHELGHVLGLYHEHSRPDRDNYIIVNDNNIRADKEKEFKKYSEVYVNTYGVDYDYSSIMHYGPEVMYLTHLLFTDIGKFKGRNYYIIQSNSCKNVQFEVNVANL